MTIQRGVRSVKPTCFENPVTKGAPKIVMEILENEKLVTACLVQQTGLATYLRTSL
jgi:hypothetical protein